MLYVFILDSFNYAHILFCMLLFACTSHLMLYTLHCTMITCQPLFLVMSFCTYYARVLLVGHTIVVPNQSYLILLLLPNFKKLLG